jgi:RNA polymerase sigma-32 factor
MTGYAAVESYETLRGHAAQANRFPMLSAEEERTLARRWRIEGHRRSFDRLVQSHMRLAVKLAARYARSGLSVADLVSEANIGLVKAAQRFDPEKGFRFATYAVWWIKAEVQAFIVQNWSMVKGGNTAALKRLFFNLRRTQRQLGLPDRLMNDDEAARVARTLDASVDEVREMEGRLRGQVSSLNAPVGEGSEHEAIDHLADDSESIEDRLAEESETAHRRSLVIDAMAALGPREREVFTLRNLTATALTLESLANRYGVSKERVRQIEAGAYNKVVRVVAARIAPETISVTHGTMIG